MGYRLKTLSRRSKLFVILCNDFLLGLVCWLVFGPPMATYIASEFSTDIIDILVLEWESFVLPILTSIIICIFPAFINLLLNFLIPKTLF